MANFNIEMIGAEEFKEAINRNPQVTTNETKKFIQRAIAKYKSGILNNAWKMGASGGGSPVASVNGGNLRDTHLTEITNMEGRIFPTASYARYVHGDDGKLFNKRGVQLRPYLDYVFKDKMPDIEALESNLIEVIVNNLAG